MTQTTPGPAGNRYDVAEWAGAFGDLGTLRPFVLAYLSILKLDPVGVLFGFGVSMIVCGWYYKTPFPVQPMKAAGAVATAGLATIGVELRWPAFAWPRSRSTTCWSALCCWPCRRRL